MSAVASTAAAAIAHATQACGVIVKLRPQEFLQVLDQQSRPLVVRALGGFFNPKYQYLTSYKGLAFFTKSSYPLALRTECETVIANQIWIP